MSSGSLQMVRDYIYIQLCGSPTIKRWELLNCRAFENPHDWLLIVLMRKTLPKLCYLEKKDKITSLHEKKPSKGMDFAFDLSSIDSKLCLDWLCGKKSLVRWIIRPNLTFIFFLTNFVTTLKVGWGWGRQGVTDTFFCFFKQCFQCFFEVKSLSESKSRL